MYVELPEDDVGTVFEIVFPNHDYVLPALCINCGQPSMQMKDVRAISGTQSNLGSTTTRYNVIKVPVCEKGHVSEHFTMKGVGYSPLGKDADGYGGVPAYYSIQTSSYRVFKEFVRLNPKYAQLSGTKWM